MEAKKRFRWPSTVWIGHDEKVASGKSCSIDQREAIVEMFADLSVTTSWIVGLEMYRIDKGRHLAVVAVVAAGKGPSCESNKAKEIEWIHKWKDETCFPYQENGLLIASECMYVRLRRVSITHTIKTQTSSGVLVLMRRREDGVGVGKMNE